MTARHGSKCSSQVETIKDTQNGRDAIGGHTTRYNNWEDGCGKVQESPSIKIADESSHQLGFTSTDANRMKFIARACDSWMRSCLAAIYIRFYSFCSISIWPRDLFPVIRPLSISRCRCHSPDRRLSLS